MPMTLELFAPAACVLFPVTAASTRVALPGALLGSQVRTVRLYNAGGADCFVECGGASVVAAVGTSMILPVGAVEVVKVLPGWTHIAGIVVAGSANLYLAVGEGA